MTQLPDGLPELPREAGTIFEDGTFFKAMGVQLDGGSLDFHTADQMTAYGVACYQAGLERAAVLCDEHEGMVDGAAYYAVSRCAAAIRAEKALTDTALPPPA